MNKGGIHLNVGGGSRSQGSSPREGSGSLQVSKSLTSSDSHSPRAKELEDSHIVNDPVFTHVVKQLDERNVEIVSLKEELAEEKKKLKEREVECENLKRRLEKAKTDSVRLNATNKQLGDDLKRFLTWEKELEVYRREIDDALVRATSERIFLSDKLSEIEVNLKQFQSILNGDLQERFSDKINELEKSFKEASELLEIIISQNPGEEQRRKIKDILNSLKEKQKSIIDLSSKKEDVKWYQTICLKDLLSRQMICRALITIGEIMAVIMFFNFCYGYFFAAPVANTIGSRECTNPECPIPLV